MAHSLTGCLGIHETGLAVLGVNFSTGAPNRGHNAEPDVTGVRARVGKAVLLGTVLLGQGQLFGAFIQLVPGGGRLLNAGFFKQGFVVHQHQRRLALRNTINMLLILHQGEECRVKFGLQVAAQVGHQIFQRKQQPLNHKAVGGRCRLAHHIRHAYTCAAGCKLLCIELTVGDGFNFYGGAGIFSLDFRFRLFKQLHPCALVVAGIPYFDGPQRFRHTHCRHAGQYQRNRQQPYQSLFHRGYLLFVYWVNQNTDRMSVDFSEWPARPG